MLCLHSLLQINFICLPFWKTMTQDTAAFYRKKKKGGMDGINNLVNVWEKRGRKNETNTHSLVVLHNKTEHERKRRQRCRVCEVEMPGSRDTNRHQTFQPNSTATALKQQPLSEQTESCCTVEVDRLGRQVLLSSFLFLNGNPRQPPTHHFIPDLAQHLSIYLSFSLLFSPLSVSVCVSPAIRCHKGNKFTTCLRFFPPTKTSTGKHSLPSHQRSPRIKSTNNSFHPQAFIHSQQQLGGCVHPSASRCMVRQMLLTQGDN